VDTLQSSNTSYTFHQNNYLKSPFHPNTWPFAHFVDDLHAEMELCVTTASFLRKFWLSHFWSLMLVIYCY